MNDLDALSHVATGRDKSFIHPDMKDREQDLCSRLRHARVLVIGGAGSIGRGTISELIKFKPAALDVVDLNENNLAEVVRELRAQELGGAGSKLKALPLDFGGEIFHRFLAGQAPYQYVFNFAAVKHVRSEKDIFSILHMFDTNVLKQFRVLSWLGEHHPRTEYFSVSTDKAANPVNLMGASKKIMEHVIFCDELFHAPLAAVKSARFANVAFSDGSLLWSWTRRLLKRQPLAVPTGVSRFFVSLEEAGQICLLAGLLGGHRRLLVPRLDPSKELRSLTDIARRYLAHHGLKAREYVDAGEAAAAVERDLAAGFYPLLLTPPDTSGEKTFEEFVGEGEALVETGMRALQEVMVASVAAKALGEFLRFVEAGVSNFSAAISKKQMLDKVADLLKDFHHLETGKNLDERF